MPSTKHVSSAYIEKSNFSELEVISFMNCRLGLQEGGRKVEKEGRELRNGGRKEDEE